MNRSHSSNRAVGLCAVLVCLIVTVALASFGENGEDLSHYTIDGGGGTSISGDGAYVLSGTIGQPDAGGPMTGSGYQLTGGFWPGTGMTTPGTNPTLVGAWSRKTHGPVGDLDIELTLAGDPPVSEPRREPGLEAGATRIVLRFSLPVELTCANVTLASGACAGVTDLGGNFYEVGISGGAIDACQTLTLVNVAAPSPGLPLTGDNDVSVLNYPANAREDFPIDVVDMSAIKGHLFETVTDANKRSDIRADGDIDVVDMSAVKGRLFTPGPTCP